MAAPVINFTDPIGLSTLLDNPVPVSLPKGYDQSITPFLCRLANRFQKWALIKQSGIAKDLLLAPVIPVIMPGFKPMTKLLVLTFPAIYKTRTGRLRPSKGQLWPRTR